MKQLDTIKEFILNNKIYSKCNELEKQEIDKCFSSLELCGLKETIREMKLGDTISLNMTGFGNVEFELANISNNIRTLVIKDILCFLPYSVENNDYEKSDLKRFVNRLVECFDTKIKDMIVEHRGQFTYVPTLYEMGIKEKYDKEVGQPFELYVSNEKRIKKFNGDERWYWTSTPGTTGSDYAWIVFSDGSSYDYYVTYTGGVVFALDLMV